jgi:hypothetical protein
MLSASPESSLPTACVPSPTRSSTTHFNCAKDVTLGRLAAVTHLAQHIYFFEMAMASSNIWRHAFYATLIPVQCLGAVEKVELEHLAISVLDNLGVDGVMRVSK